MPVEYNGNLRQFTTRFAFLPGASTLSNLNLYSGLLARLKAANDIEQTARKLHDVSPRLDSEMRRPGWKRRAGRRRCAQGTTAREVFRTSRRKNTIHLCCSHGEVGRLFVARYARASVSTKFASFFPFPHISFPLWFSLRFLYSLGLFSRFCSFPMLHESFAYLRERPIELDRLFAKSNLPRENWARTAVLTSRSDKRIFCRIVNKFSGNDILNSRFPVSPLIGSANSIDFILSIAANRKWRKNCYNTATFSSPLKTWNFMDQFLSQLSSPIENRFGDFLSRPFSNP